MAVSTESLLGIIDANLRKFAESLKASEKYGEEGRQMVDKVGRILQEHSEFSIAKRFVAGSVGKSTDVIAPDFDIVIVVNNQEPPFEDVLTDFRNILSRNSSSLEIKRRSIKMFGKRCVQFTFTNQIDVDLLVGANLPVEEIRSRMLTDPERSKIYSTSLVEEAKAFMKCQSSFTHSLVRLGKFWFRSLHFGDKVFGGSTIIELVCVAAALEEEETKSPSMFQAFSLVIDMFTRLDSLKLAFRQSRGGKWRTIPVDVLDTKHVRFGVWGYCNKPALSEPYFILEAINPLNNLLARMDPETIRKFKKFAYKTKARLRELMSGNGLIYHGGQCFIQFEKLFEPQPPNLMVALELTEIPNFLVTYSDRCSSSLTSPEMEVRNPEEVMECPEIEATAYAMKTQLASLVNSLVRGSPSTNKRHIRSAIQNMIVKNFQIGLKDVCEGKQEEHEDYDVTITIPYSLGHANYAVRFSLASDSEDEDDSGNKGGTLADQFWKLTLGLVFVYFLFL